MWWDHSTGVGKVMDFTPIGIFSTPTGVFFFLWQQILHLPHYCTCLFNESYGFNTVTKFISHTGTAGNHVKLTSALYKILKSSGGWTESQQWPSQQKQLLTPLQVTWPILRSQWCARKTLFTYFTQPVKTSFFLGWRNRGSIISWLWNWSFLQGKSYSKGIFIFI